MNFKSEIAKILEQHTELSYTDILKILEVPANKSMGDFAFPCFTLAKTMKKAPPLIAKEIAEQIQPPNFILRIEVVNAYINFYINQAIFIECIISRILQEKEQYGQASIGKDKTIVIDYSSPNIAKPFHVGHLRSTVIGNALYKLHSALGYECVGVNHLGDWGTQFGKLIVAYKNWGIEELIQSKGIQYLMEIYVKFHDEAKQNPSLEDEARLWFVKMQEGDKEALHLWKWFYDISIVEFERVYQMLGVSFDAFTGESFYNDKMDAIVSELKEKNLLIESEGALIVDLENENMPPCLIIRKDGGTLYATRDITAGIYRKKTYNFEKCLYLTALDQNLHFAQWFEVIRKMGYEWADDLIHVPFGLVSLDSGKLSTRQGNIILMEELLQEAIKETKRIIEEKNPNLEDKDNIAKQVGIGAVIFNDLYHNRSRDVVFSWEKMLNFDGETGPYVQYTHARACSILKKAGDISLKSLDYTLLQDDASFELTKTLELFPDKIVEACEKLEPSIVTRHIVSIAQAFNKFYHDNPILTSEENVRMARLSLVFCVQIVLEKGLSLLGIESPNQM